MAETTTEGERPVDLYAILQQLQGTVELQGTLIHTLYDQCVAQQKAFAELQRRVEVLCRTGWKRGN